MQDAKDVALCRITQLGLLRLLCNPSVMEEDVCTLEQAWDVYNGIHNDERFTFVPEPKGLEKYFREYSSSVQVSPKIWQDAYIAAFARSAKMLLTTFDRGFGRYDGLHVNLLKGK